MSNYVQIKNKQTLIKEEEFPSLSTRRAAVANGTANPSINVKIDNTLNKIGYNLFKKNFSNFKYETTTEGVSKKFQAAYNDLIAIRGTINLSKRDFTVEVEFLFYSNDTAPTAPAKQDNEQPSESPIVYTFHTGIYKTGISYISLVRKKMVGELSEVARKYLKAGNIDRPTYQMFIQLGRYLNNEGNFSVSSK